MDYKDAGVNIELGDDVSKMLYEAAKQTWNNRKGRLGEVITPFDDFSGVRAINVGNLPADTMMNIGFDGVGTKMEIAERVGKHTTIAFDLFAMVCDDAVVRGAEPVLIGSILDVKSLGTDEHPYTEQVKQLCIGYVRAANAANVAVVNGEVAELGDRVHGYGPFNYNWGAGVVWFAKKERMFTGREVKEGDKLVGLRELGFRSNGLSLVRKVMIATHGDDWHNAPWEFDNGSNESPLGHAVLMHSQIYTNAAVDMFGGYEGEPKAEVHGIAHITGGGLPGKLRRILKVNNLGAMIDTPIDPSNIMLYASEIGNVPDEKVYSTWNMGQGMVIVTPTPERVIEIAASHSIDAKVIGEVRADPRIIIKSKGVFSNGKELMY